MEYERAKEIAFTYGDSWSHCEEWTDAYIFSVKEDALSLGGGQYPPIVIIKRSGDAVGMTQYLCMESEADELIREFDI